MTTANDADHTARMRHLVDVQYRWGWWMLLAFLSLGLLLEALHGFKVGFYLDVANETRRLMWTLGHAHGTLLAVVQLVFASYLHARPEWTSGSMTLASRALRSGGILLPLSFFLSGVYIYDGDPGIFVFLAPIGALLVLLAVFLIARSTLRSGRTLVLDIDRPA